MAQRTAARPDFHSTVKLVMSKRDWGARSLAKQLAGDEASHEQIEVERRSVRRWLKGAQPSQVNRRRVAVALGLPEDMFDEEDEEDSLSSFLQREVGLATRKWEQRQAARQESADQSMTRAVRS